MRMLRDQLGQPRWLLLAGALAALATMQAGQRHPAGVIDAAGLPRA